MDQSPAKADVQVAATALGGRDFEGQATKEINGKTYILIGNEQQLRAIGSGKKVIGRINKVTQTCIQQGALNYQWVDGTPSSEYAGDADLSDSDICAILMPPTTTVHCWHARRKRQQDPHQVLRRGC